VSKEALMGAVCVLGVLSLGACGERAADDVRERPPRSEFAGGFDSNAQEIHRMARRVVARAPARERRAGGVVTLRRAATVRARPGGRRLGKIGPRTPFGSRMTLPVVRRRPGWLGVLTSALPNNTLGWIRDEGLDHDRTRLEVVVDRSARRLTLLRGGRRLMSAPIGVGRPGSETPLGTFAITDKLDGRRFSASYGCCILALSGRQPSLPAGWRGGDRLAIHGTTGRSSSAGCVTMGDAQLRQLLRTVPLGTLVTVRA
jgi:hypothetical protein